MHPSPSVIPASLAIGERENSNGKDLILSVVLGYEAMIMVAAAIHPSCLKRCSAQCDKKNYELDMEGK